MTQTPTSPTAAVDPDRRSDDAKSASTTVADDADASNPGEAGAVAEVYRALERGVGREQVTDANVADLIQMAQSSGDAQLEYLLREWRSPCGDDPDAPPLSEIQGNPPPA